MPLDLTRAESIERAARALSSRLEDARHHDENGDAKFDNGWGVLEALYALDAALSLPAPREATPVARDDKPILFSHEKYDGLHQTIVRQFVNCYAGFDPASDNMTQRASWAVRPIMDAAVAMANDAVHRDRGAS